MTAGGQTEFQGTERFGILRRLGAGGMGVVYEAYDRERESLVALKTLQRASPETVFQFKQEFRSLARVVHPNLVPLYELVSDGERWFFTMELLRDAVDLRKFYQSEGALPAPGDSAASSFAEDETIDAPSGEVEWNGPETREPPEAGGGPPPPARTLDRSLVAEVFGQLATGVIALHQAGVLHRDLKPENVMVREDGRVVLLDFGLVQELGAESGRVGGRPAAGDSAGEASSGSGGNRVTGSVGYMAPEQAAAETLTPASDWYAVGVMLYEILTGRLPITGRPMEILRAKQLTDPPPPKSLVANVPDDLADLCMEMLDRDPARRPSGPEVVARLRGEEGPTEIEGSAARVAAATPFVGRTRQLEVLERSFKKTEAGVTGVCRVHGRSGAGKTALIEHFLEGLSDRSDPVVLVGRCYEQESVPYKAVDSLLDALTRYLLRLSPDELRGLLPERMEALVRVFPALRRVPTVEAAEAGRDGGGSLEELRSQAFGALRELLARIGERHPLVLYIDDLQWGDMDSAALIRDILCSAAPPRLLMLFCFRTEYVGFSPCLRALEDLAADAVTPVFQEDLVVDALTAEETRDLAMALIGAGAPDAEAQADWVVEESGGSALFIYELVRHLQAGMERFEAAEVHLDEVLWRRVQRLAEGPRRLLEVIAVASRPIRLRHVQEAASFRTLPPEVVGALRAERLVRTTGPGLEDEVESYHDRIRESIVARLPASVIQAHHASLAASLEADGDAMPELLAVHLEGAGETVRAGGFYLQAAEEATEALAFDRAEGFYQRALAFAGDTPARARILERLVHFYTDLARFDDAYRAGRDGAVLFGIRLPAKFHPPSFVADLVGARLRLGRREVADILELPTMGDERLAGAVRLMAAVAKAAYQLRPELCVAVNARMVNLCLKHGNTADSSIGYMVFGSIFLGGILGQYRRGYEFGRLALDLVEKYENLSQKAEVNFVVGYFGTSWQRPAIEAEELWEAARSAGLETGDLFHTGCACCATVLGRFMRGAPIAEIRETSDAYLELLRRVGLREPEGAVTAVRQAVRNLQGETRGRGDFGDGEFDEASFVEGLAAYGSRHFAHYYYVVKMQTAYLWGDLESALKTVREADGYLKDSAGMLHSAEHRLYHALILAALVVRGDAPNRRAAVRTIRRQHRLLRKWAALCPHNFLHKERLVAAELARIGGDRSRALRLLREAGDAAAEFGYVQIEALAQRLAWEQHRDRDPAAAARHLSAATGLYRRWGASAYAEGLERGIIANEIQSERYAEGRECRA